MDMTNSSSTYLGIIAGAMIGGIISWWIFDRQKKTSDKQDYTLKRIEQLENYNEKLLEKIKVIEEKNEKLLEKIFDLNKKIDSLLEGR
jgi:Na+/glutamate symporter